MYNKIFTKILDSSVWLEPTPTRIVWITLLAAMDEEGFCPFAAVGNVAGRARVTLEEARVALESLEAPDKESSDQDNDGRRIERVPGGWFVLNAPKYRAIVTRVEEKNAARERQRRHRAKDSVTQESQNVTNGHICVTQSEAEAETEVNTETEGNGKARPVNPDSGAELVLAAWLFQELGIPSDFGTRDIAAQAIRLLAKEGGTVKTAAEYILAAAQEAKRNGETINRFWFIDQKYQPQTKPAKADPLSKMKFANVGKK